MLTPCPSPPAQALGGHFRLISSSGGYRDPDVCSKTICCLLSSLWSGLWNSVPPGLLPTALWRRLPGLLGSPYPALPATLACPGLLHRCAILVWVLPPRTPSQPFLYTQGQFIYRASRLGDLPCCSPIPHYRLTSPLFTTPTGGGVSL